MKSLCMYLALLCIIGLPWCARSFRSSNSANNSSPLVFTGHDQYQQCPTWFFWNETSLRCQCGPSSSSVSCYQNKNQTLLRWVFCMTYDDSTESTVLATCPFGNLQPKHDDSVPLPENRLELTDAMCGKSNREGLLCSRCKPGYGPAVLSYKHECARCSGSYLGWLLYFCVALVPTTLFFLIIVLCQVHTTSAPMNFFVYACQIFSVSISVLPQEIVYNSEQMKLASGIAVTAVTSWNLDFLLLIIPPFCVSENLSNLQILSMDYIIAFYPLFLTAVMYVCIQQHARGCRLLVCLWTPFGYCLSPLMRRLNWNPGNSIIPIFASFLLLSSSKILYVSSTLLQKGQFTSLSNIGEVSQHDKVLYYDPSLTFFGQRHIPYAILAALVAAIFVIFPAVLLTLYPTRLLQKFLNCCGFSCHAVHAFADAFNGCYKNGANGTRDYRCFAGFYLLARVVGITIFTSINEPGLHFPLLKIMSIASLFIMALTSPYKRRLFNVLDSCGLTLMAFRLCIGEFVDIFNSLCIASIALYFAFLISLKIALTLNCCKYETLKALLHQIAGGSEVSLPVDRETGDMEENLPDRLMNPDGYRLLSEEVEETQTMAVDSDNTIPTYGSI